MCEKMKGIIFSNVTPEQVGIMSESVSDYIRMLEEHGLYMHSILIARGERLFCEAYYKPFNRIVQHRMYSTAKSYVGIAVCELAAEGKLSLDTPITEFFGDVLPENIHPYLKAQTVRHMLKMQTCKNGGWYFQPEDRLRHYFSFPPTHYPGTGYDYDSNGSFVLGELVRRISGKDFLSYLKELCLDEIGFSKNARCLTLPGGYAWADSALLCTPLDMLKFGRLIARGGECDGKQLLRPDAVAMATGNYTDTSTHGVRGYSNRGYGCQIWHSFDNSFVFNGMHDQVMLYDPARDISFVCTAGNPPGVSRELILTGLYEKIIRSAQDNPFPENVEAFDRLKKKTGMLELRTSDGEPYSDFEEKISGIRYALSDNPMGISEFTLNFSKSGGSFCYVNRQGKKELRFGRRKNIIGQFPQTGYSRETGGEECPGNTYRCAASGAWSEPQRFSITVQIIDDYIGLLSIIIGFNAKHAWLAMRKSAENFLDEYDGFADAVQAELRKEEKI